MARKIHEVTIMGAKVILIITSLFLLGCGSRHAVMKPVFDPPYDYGYNQEDVYLSTDTKNVLDNLNR